MLAVIPGGAKTGRGGKEGFKGLEDVKCIGSMAKDVQMQIRSFTVSNVVTFHCNCT